VLSGKNNEIRFAGIKKAFRFSEKLSKKKKIFFS